MTDYPANVRDLSQYGYDKLRAELEQAQVDNAALLKWFKATRLACNTSNDPNKILSDLAEAIDKYILATDHPGAALLKELEGLRDKNADYKDMVGISCEEYRIHREKIGLLEKELEQYKRALELACAGIADDETCPFTWDCKNPDVTHEECALCIKGKFLAQAKAGESNEPL